MIPYTNIGYKYRSKYGSLSSDEFSMPRISIENIGKRYRLFNSTYDFEFKNKYELKIWMNLNGYKIYRAYIYYDTLLKHKGYDNNNVLMKCQLLLTKQ